MGICEQCVCAPEIGRLGVHRGNECRLRAALAAELRTHGIRDGDSRVVARRGEKRLGGVLHRKHVALLERCRGLADGGCLSAHRHLIGELGVLQGNDRRHDLGHRGDMRLLVGVALEVHRAAAVDHVGIRRIDARALRDGKSTRFDSLASDDIGFRDAGESGGGHESERERDCEYTGAKRGKRPHPEGSTGATRDMTRASNQAGKPLPGIQLRSQPLRAWPRCLPLHQFSVRRSPFRD